MKSSIIALFVFAFVLNRSGAQSTALRNQVTVPAPTSYAIVSQDANSRVWQREDYEAGPNGVIETNVHSYTELASGLNYWRNNEWNPSQDLISILPDGTASATNGQHQAYWPVDIYNGQIEVVTPEGFRVFSEPLELSYYDGTNTVVLAELTNSVGALVGNNQVVYPNAFAGLKADLRYTYTESGFEQDVVVRQQPLTPESYGLNPTTARLQVVTEFFNSPEPAVANTLLPQQAGIALTDESIAFGTMTMVPGKAFLLGQAAADPGVLVAKSWLALDGRQFLVEEVPVNAIIDGLEALPLTALNRSSGKVAHLASRRAILPRHKPGNKSAAMRILPKGRMPATGFVLDYNTINSSLTNYTFQGDTTYFISGGVNLYGTTTIEGGTVLKYTNNAYLLPLGLVNCKTGPYRPAIFTAKDDNSVGDAISGSTGIPIGNYANPELFFDGEVAGFYLHDLRLCYAGNGIELFYSNPYTNSISNCQLGNVGNAVYCYNPYTAPTLVVENVLMYQVQYNAFNIYGGTCSAQYCTVNQANRILTIGGGATVQIANSLFVGITNSGSSFTSINNATNNSGNVFQVVGAGDYYLANGSPYHNIGQTNIDPALLAELGQKTTYPPLILSNSITSSPTTLGPQAGRDDVGYPDLGYHYDPIDYLVDYYKITNATLTIASGTAIGCYNDYAGILPGSGSSIISIGTPIYPNWIVRYSSVQEQALSLGPLAPSSAVSVSPYQVHANEPSGVFSFTKFACPAGMGGGGHLNHNVVGSFATLLVQNCEFWGGIDKVGGYSNTVATLNNNLFVRCDLTGAIAGSASYLSLTNNLFWGVALIGLNPSGAAGWSALNNDFDSCGITPGSALANGNNNAYLNCVGQFPPTNSTDIVSTNGLDYQTSFLGTFYQPPTSPINGMGNTNANLLGLYHFTTHTNQTIEATSIVAIGYHYVATDTNGIPLDTNGDGIPDYIEDANGNGLVDSGEIGWNLTNDLGLQVIITQPAHGSSLP